MGATRQALFAGLRRGLAHAAWMLPFVAPLMYYQFGPTGIWAAIVFSAMPITFTVGEAFVDAVIGPWNEKMARRYGDFPVEQHLVRRPGASPFLVALIMGVGLAFIPVVDELFPKTPQTRTNGAALLGFWLGLLATMAGCMVGQQSAQFWPRWKSRMVILLAFAIFLGFSQWKEGSPYHLIGALTTVGMVAGGIAGYVIGYFVTPSLDVLGDLWIQIRKMGFALGAFLLGYIMLVLMFTCIYAAVWKFEPTSFQGAISARPQLPEFAYFSVVTAGTLGYGDIVPAKGLARLFAAIEVLLSVGWTIVGFAAVVERFRREERPVDRG